MNEIKQQLKKDIVNQLLTNKPELTQKSLQAYASGLSTLYIKTFPEQNFNLQNFNNTEFIDNYLQDKKNTFRKAIYAALVSLTANEHYRNKMYEEAKIINEQTNTQLKTHTQQDNWVETEQVQNIFNNLANNAKDIYKKKDLNIGDLQQIQNYIIMALTSGEFIPPRRSIDYTEMKIKNIDINKDNYIDGKYFIFNTYKTAKDYGQQKIEIPVKLRNILKKWKTVNPTDYLLFDNNNNKLTNVKLNQRMNKIFDGKKIAINTMRHTYLTDKYKDTSKNMKDLGNDMRMMGSSINQEMVYIKN